MKNVIQGEKVELPLGAYDFKRLSQETAHLMIAAMVDGLTVVGLDGKILDCNDAILRLHGVSRDEYVGKSVYDFVAPEDRQRAIREAPEVLEKERLRSEVKALRKEGGTFDAEINLSLLKDSSGEPSAFLEVTRDITEWNKKKEAVRESEANFRSIFENASDCMIYFDAAGRILDVNRKAVDVFGGSKKELLGKHFTKTGVISPRDIPVLMRAFANGLAGKHPTYDICIRNKKGKEILLECSGSFAKRDYNPTLLVIARDVTERKQVEEALRKSEERYRNIVELAPDGIITADRKGVITSINTAFSKWTGYSKEEIVGKHFTKLRTIHVRDIPTYVKLYSEVLRGKIRPPTEFVYYRKDGMARWCEAHIGILEESGKRIGFQVILRDITERKKIEEALRESEERYREVTESISDVFFAMDKNLRYVYWNNASEKLTGISAKDAIGKFLTEIFPDVKGTRVEQSYLKTLRTKQSQSFVYEYRVKGKDFVFEINAYPTKDGLSVFVKDITERRMAEEALRNSENKLKMLLNNLPQKIFFKNKNSVYVSCNKNYARDLKIKSDEIAGKTDYDFYPKKLAEKYRTDDKRIMESEKIEDIEEEYIQDGRRVFVHTVKTPVKDEKGNVVGILGIFWDITEHKKTEEALRESEEKYRNLFQNARDVILTSDLKGKITSINKAVEEYGFKKNEIVEKNMLEFVSKRYWPTLLKDVTNVAQGKSVKGEIEITTPKGKVVVEYGGNPIIKGNNIIGTQTILRDVTERKELEQKLRHYSEHLEELVRKKTDELLESEKRYSVLVEEATDGVVILQDGKIDFANRRAAEIFEYSREELIGMPLEKPVDEKYRQLVMERYTRRLRGEKVPIIYEIEVITKNSEHRPIELSATRVNYQGRPADLIIIRDISERKRMEEQRLRLEKLATMGELAGMVAHDLRNPLTAIRNATYYIKKTCSCDVDANKTRLEMLDIIEQETLSANNIINDLLDFSAKRPLQKTSQNMNEIIEVSVAKSNAPKNISIETHFAKDAAATVDEKQLERVFLNLIKNAVQAMPNGGKLTLTTKETKDFVEIALSDTGVGIPEENMGKLFAPLFTTKAKGIGMGLPICRKIVEEHDGTISVESKVGEGTTFTIKLPKEGRGDDQ